jgi:putative FmdB family regulatory protein
MPTYAYRCTNPDCLHEQDFFHGINEGGAPLCSQCGQPMKRLLSAAPHKFMNPRGTMGVISGGKRSDISN